MNNQFKWKLLSTSFFEVYCLLCCTKWFYLLSLWVKLQSMTIQMTATKQYFPMVLFITFVHSGWVLTLLEFLWVWKKDENFSLALDLKICNSLWASANKAYNRMSRASQCLKDFRVTLKWKRANKTETTNERK